MKRTSLTIALLCLALVALTLPSSAPATLFAQIEPTAQAQTNDAAVQRLFAQTETAAATQTVAMMFNQAQTATAVSVNAPTQTVEALFNTALTATAMGDVPDYTRYRLLDVQEFDLLAAPANSAAHLSPDGTQFIHFHGDQACVYALTGTRWAQDRCFEIDSRALGNPEELFWSPAGRYLTLSTYLEGLQRFSDTDIRVLDIESGTIINLTDDGVEGSLMGDVYTGNFDLAARWLDADTIAFLRYGSLPPTSDRSFALTPPALYTVDLPTDGVLNEPELGVAITTPFQLAVYVLAVDPRRERMAFNYDTRNSEPVQGIWQGGLDGDNLRAISRIPENRDLPTQLDYSADGRYLLTFQPSVRRSLIRTVSTETGEISDIDPLFPTLFDGDTEGDPNAPQISGAGWSPRGSALAYIVNDLRTPEASGLYLTRAPGEPGTLILQGERLYGTTCCQRMPITWATNDIIMIGRGSAPGVLLVQVGF